MGARERVEYLWEDFLSRPERVRFARTAGMVLGSLLLLGLALLLARGHAKPVKHPKPERQEAAAAPAPPTVRDAFAFAKDLEGRLRSDARFSRVYIVPSAASASQNQSKVVVMGEVNSTEIYDDLRREVVKGGAPVTVEWQVAVATSK